MSGKISIKTREANVERFRNDTETKVLIASIKTGGLGLDLTMANKCIICDPWWNEAVETQASISNIPKALKVYKILKRPNAFITLSDIM